MRLGYEGEEKPDKVMQSFGNEEEKLNQTCERSRGETRRVREQRALWWYLPGLEVFVADGGNGTVHGWVQWEQGSVPLSADSCAVAAAAEICPLPLPCPGMWLQGKAARMAPPAQGTVLSGGRGSLVTPNSGSLIQPGLRVAHTSGEQ